MDLAAQHTPAEVARECAAMAKHRVQTLRAQAADAKARADELESLQNDLEHLAYQFDQWQPKADAVAGSEQ